MTPLEHFPWGDDPILLTQSFALRRSLASFPFPGRMSDIELEQTSHLMQALLSKTDLFPPLQIIPIAELKSQEKEYLSEHFLFENPIQEAPKSSAIAFDKESLFYAKINVSDHLKLTWYMNDSPLSHFSKIAAPLHQSLEFAFSPKFGFLTTDIKDCGTGLRVGVYLHLPYLILSKKLPPLLKSLSPIIEVSGDSTADIVHLSNRYCIGIHEDDIFLALQNALNTLISEEKSLRSQYIDKKDLLIEDTVLRAYGLIQFAKQLSLKEAYQVLSMLKLGQDLGIVQNLSQRTLNELFFKVKRSHLDEKLSLEEASIKRANLMSSSIFPK